MIVVLAAITVCEAAFPSYGLTHAWVPKVTLLINLWGGLDALLRFPAAHDLESFFAGKQLSLIVIK